MEKLKAKIQLAQKAVGQLKKGLARIEKGTAKEDYEFFRDALIKRFEFSYEVTWKLMRLYLEQIKKVSNDKISSPRSIFRTAHETALINNEEFGNLLAMVDDRNLTSHTYEEETAEEIFRRIEAYTPLLNKIVTTISTSTERALL